MVTDAEKAALAWRDMALLVQTQRGHGLPGLMGYTDLRQRADGSWPQRSEVQPSRYRHVLWIAHRQPMPPIGDPYLLPWDLVARKKED